MPHYEYQKAIKVAELNLFGVSLADLLLAKSPI